MTFQPKDLVVLVPDNNMQSAIVGILEKHRRLGARAITLLGPYVDSKRDSGVYLRAHALLRELQREASYSARLAGSRRVWKHRSQGSGRGRGRNAPGAERLGPAVCGGRNRT